MGRAMHVDSKTFERARNEPSELTKLLDEGRNSSTPSARLSQLAFHTPHTWSSGLVPNLALSPNRCYSAQEPDPSGAPTLRGRAWCYGIVAAGVPDIPIMYAKNVAALGGRPSLPDAAEKSGDYAHVDAWIEFQDLTEPSQLLLLFGYDQDPGGRRTLAQYFIGGEKVDQRDVLGHTACSHALTIDLPGDATHVSVTVQRAIPFDPAGGSTVDPMALMMWRGLDAYLL